MDFIFTNNHLHIVHESGRGCSLSVSCHDLLEIVTSMSLVEKLSKEGNIPSPIAIRCIDADNDNEALLILGALDSYVLGFKNDQEGTPVVLSFHEPIEDIILSFNLFIQSDTGSIRQLFNDDDDADFFYSTLASLVDNISSTGL